MLFLLPLGENQRAHDGDEDEKRSQFERVDEFFEKHGGNLPGCAGDDLLAGACNVGAGLGDSSCDGSGKRKGERKTGKFCNFRKVGALFFSGIQEHDDEDEENHDGAAVNDDLHSGDKFRAHQEIETRETDHNDDKRKSAVNRMLLQDEAERAEDGESGEDEEDEQHGRHGLLLSRTTAAVKMTFAIETGSKSFQPTFISWS